MPEEFSDIELIEKYLNNNTAAFDILYSRYRRQLYAYLNRLMPGQYALADDVFQNTWVKVIKQLPKYKHKEKFLAWVTRIAHNLAVDHFRKSKHEILAEDTESTRLFAAIGNEPWRVLDKSELSASLEKCVAKLQEEQREVFILRQNEMSFKEISKIQSVSINTALGRMQYALKNLRGCMAVWKNQ